MTTPFTTILMDCPWPERGSGKICRGAQNHYPLIKTEPELLRTIVQAPCWNPADNAHLFMWATDNYLEWALRLYVNLGFKRHRSMPWRVRPGIGQYMQSCHTWLLFGTRGKGKKVLKQRIRTDALWDATIPKREHSRKPDRQYELIEKMSRGPYLEMFARPTARREGWTYWGNEVT